MLAVSWKAIIISSLLKSNLYSVIFSVFKICNMTYEVWLRPINPNKSFSAIFSSYFLSFLLLNLSVNQCLVFQLFYLVLIAFQ